MLSIVERENHYEIDGARYRKDMLVKQLEFRLAEARNRLGILQQDIDCPLKTEPEKMEASKLCAECRRYMNALTIKIQYWKRKQKCQTKTTT